nr:hypothetical protein [Rathayibacter iranicus]
MTAFVGLMHRDGQVLKKKSWLIRPGIPIPRQATAVHGVTTTHADEHGQDPAVADIARVLRDMVRLLAFVLSSSSRPMGFFAGVVAVVP